MIDLEQRLRRGLSEAAGTQHVPGDFGDRVARHVSVVRRRRVLGRSVAAVAALAAILVGANALQPDTRGSRIVAGGRNTTTGWHPIADAPISDRFQNLSLAMGDRVLVWGGVAGQTPQLDGAVFDAAHGTWTKLPASPLSSNFVVAAWTGREAILISANDGKAVTAAYDPEKNAWRRLAAPHLPTIASAIDDAVWTGTELIVIGSSGGEDSHDFANHVAIYDPTTNRWRTGSVPTGPLPIFGDAVWTGTEVAVVGAVNESGSSVGNNTLLAYDPATDHWREIPWGLDGVRGNPVVAWTGTKLFIGGGRNRSGTTDGNLRDAALVDLTSGTWDKVPESPVAFDGNNRFGELWTGNAVLTLNGKDTRPVAFNPSTSEWHVGPASPTGVRREEVSWSWVSSQRFAVVWGGVSCRTLSPGTSTCDTQVHDGETYTP